MLSLIVERALRGEASPRADLDFLEDSPALDELVEAAHLVTTKCASRVFNFCTIVNAKSGRCAEDCRWCSQSSKWTTNAPVFPIVPATRGESAAARALEHGIRRLSFVTSGRKLSARELREIRPVVEAAASTGLEVCASMGLLTEPELTSLREAGLVRYHCNLETGPNFFPKVCTTHTQTDKIRTLEAARRAGLELCSGGLFGMGETIADRIDLACGLRRPPHSRGPRGFRPICSSLFKKHVGADFAHAADAPAHSVEHEGKQNEEDDEEEYLGPAVLLPVIVRTH